LAAPWAGVELAPPAGGFFEVHGEALQPAKAMLRIVRPIVRGVARMEEGAAIGGFPQKRGRMIAGTPSTCKPEM
jgi:hypothetical protein